MGGRVDAGGHLRGLGVEKVGMVEGVYYRLRRRLKGEHCIKGG